MICDKVGTKGTKIPNSVEARKRFKLQDFFLLWLVLRSIPRGVVQRKRKKVPKEFHQFEQVWWKRKNKTVQEETARITRNRCAIHKHTRLKEAPSVRSLKVALSSDKTWPSSIVLGRFNAN